MFHLLQVFMSLRLILLLLTTYEYMILIVARGGNLGSASWASPVHLELGLGWAVNLLAQKNLAKFGPT